MENSTFDGLVRQSVKEGYWALNAYAPVFWCPYRSSTCIGGDAVTVESAPCEYPSQGSLCQDIHNSGVYLDPVSRTMEQCSVSMNAWFPVAVFLSSIMLLVLLYTSCWQVCKLQPANRPITNSPRSNFFLSVCARTQGSATAKHADDGKLASSSQEKEAPLTWMQSLKRFWIKDKLKHQSAPEEYKLQSWPVLEWLVEFHLLFMSWQICSTLPASLYTAYPALTTHFLHLMSYLSLSSPNMWPFPCFGKSSTSASGWQIPTFHYWNIMTLTTTIPIVIFLCTTCLYVFLYELYFLASDEKRRRRGQERLSTWYFTSSVCGYSVLIGSVAQLTIGSLHCVDVDPNKSVSDVETYILWQEPTLLCSGPSYTYYRIWASCSIIIYLFFVPMMFGAAIRCWRCTISVILNHAHRIANNAAAKETPVAVTKMHPVRTRSESFSDSSHSSDEEVNSQCTRSSAESSIYFLVTGGQDVAKLQWEQLRDDSSYADESQSEHKWDPIKANQTRNAPRLPQKPSPVHRDDDTHDDRAGADLVNIKVSRTVRAAGVLFMNFRQQYKYGILLEVFVRVFYMGIIPHLAQPSSTSPTQALLLPFIAAVSAALLWMILVQCRPYRRPQVQKLAELIALQVLLLSLGAMFLQLEDSAYESYVNGMTSSAWVLLDVVLVLILLFPTCYYLWHQTTPMGSSAQMVTQDAELLPSKSEVPLHLPPKRQVRKDGVFSPEYMWLRKQFQESYGITSNGPPSIQVEHRRIDLPRKDLMPLQVSHPKRQDRDDCGQVPSYSRHNSHYAGDMSWDEYHHRNIDRYRPSQRQEESRYHRPPSVYDVEMGRRGDRREWSEERRGERRGDRREWSEECRGDRRELSDERRGDRRGWSDKRNVDRQRSQHRQFSQDHQATLSFPVVYQDAVRRAEQPERLPSRHRASAYGDSQVHSNKSMPSRHEEEPSNKNKRSLSLGQEGGEAERARKYSSEISIGDENDPLTALTEEEEMERYPPFLAPPEQCPSVHDDDDAVQDVSNYRPQERSQFPPTPPDRAPRRKGHKNHESAYVCVTPPHSPCRSTSSVHSPPTRELYPASRPTPASPHTPHRKESNMSNSSRMHRQGSSSSRKKLFPPRELYEEDWVDQRRDISSHVVEYNQSHNPSRSWLNPQMRHNHHNNHQHHGYDERSERRHRGRYTKSPRRNSEVFEEEFEEDFDRLPTYSNSSAAGAQQVSSSSNTLYL